MYAYSNYLTKCKIVLLFKKKNKLELKTKLGEAICENKLVNIFEDSDHTIDKCKKVDHKLNGDSIFREYEDGKYIHKNQLNRLINYLAGNINAIWNPNLIIFKL